MSSSQISSLFGAAAGGSYDATLLGDSSTSYWKLKEASGLTFADTTSGNNPATARIQALNGLYLGSETLGVAGANSDDTAITLDGSTGYVNALTPLPNPQGQSFSEEVWFKTTTTNGGVLIGFNDALANAPTVWDRTLYMTTSGTNTGLLSFGIWNGSGISAVTSTANYNDGNWHHVVAVSNISHQLILYVDGAQVASSATGIIDNSTWAGYWHVGYNNFSGNWPLVPPSNYFSGTIDEPAIYASALSATQVSNHFHAR